MNLHKAHICKTDVFFEYLVDMACDIFGSRFFYMQIYCALYISNVMVPFYVH
jgi:hypothetical protein